MNWLNITSISKKRYTINLDQIIYIDMDYYLEGFSDKGVKLVLTGISLDEHKGLSSMSNEYIICNGKEAENIRTTFGYGDE
jgi:hypothetical protein